MIVEQQPGPIGRQEALAQIGYLRDLVEETRLRLAGGYRSFLLWGVLWAIGYLVTAVAAADNDSLPNVTATHVGVTWLGVVLIGTLFSAVVERRAHRGEVVPSLGRKLVALNIVLFSAGWLLPVFIGEPDASMTSAYWPFLVGVIYVIDGIFMGREGVWIGGWLIAASTASLFMPSWLQATWLAFTGGGGLFVTGLILRRQARAPA